VGLTFREVANAYLDHCQRRFVRKTYQYKIIVCKRFLDYAGEDLPADQVTIQLFEAFLQTRAGNISYNRHRKDLCALLVWAWKRRYIPENPCFFLEKLPEPKFIRAIPTREEMSRILLAAGQDRPFLLVLYHTLGRLDEVLRLKWEDINFTERTVRLWTRKRRGGAWEYDLFPMNQVLFDTLWGLWEARSQDTWVFYNAKTQTRYNRRPKLMKGICHRAGVPHFGFHAIRHFVASRLHDELKWSTAKVSRLLRHQAKQTTERYLQTMDGDLRAVMASLEDDILENGGTAGGNRFRESQETQSGRSAAWLARLPWAQEVGGSNPPVPTILPGSYP
jgi:integrase